MFVFCFFVFSIPSIIGWLIVYVLTAAYIWSESAAGCGTVWGHLTHTQPRPLQGRWHHCCPRGTARHTRVFASAQANHGEWRQCSRRWPGGRRGHERGHRRCRGGHRWNAISCWTPRPGTPRNGSSWTGPGISRVPTDSPDCRLW